MSALFEEYSSSSSESEDEHNKKENENVEIDFIPKSKPIKDFIDLRETLRSGV